MNNSPRHRELERLAVVTPFFPTREQPRCGLATYHLVRALGRRLSVRVFCVLPRYPEWAQPRSFFYRPSSENYSLPGVDVTYLHFPALPYVTRGLSGVLCDRAVTHALAEFGPDAVLNYWVYPQGYAAVRAAQRLHVPAIVGSIGSDLNVISDPVTRYFIKQTLKEADLVITKSSGLRDRAISLGAEPSKTHAVLNGCDTSVFHPSDRHKARLALGVGSDARVIVFVGRLEQAKGVGELITAFANLRNADAAMRLVLIGTGARAGSFVEQVRMLGLSESVQFVPELPSEGVAQWLAASDLLALPSYAEGCPNVILEAISCGRPVVATNVGGIPEIVDDRCAILVPPRDSALLAGALRDALKRRWDEVVIWKIFRRSWDEMACETLQLCRSLVGSHTAQVDRTASAKGAI